MNAFFGLRVTCILAGFICLGAHFTALADRAPVTPISPAELVKMFQPVEGEWKIVKSGAKHVYSDWLMTSATRRLEAPPLPPAPGLPAVPRSTEIRIIDSGFFPGFQGIFLSYDSYNPESIDIQKLKIGSYPAIRNKSDPAAEVLEVFVADRFIIRIRAVGQEMNAASTWLRTIKIAELAAQANSGQTKLSNPITMATVDELNPKRNRSYKMAPTTEEDLAGLQQIADEGR